MTTIPTVLATPPWTPARKRRSIVVGERPARETRIVWTSSDEQQGWAEPFDLPALGQDDIGPLPQEERDRVVLTRIASRSSLPIYAGQYLSLEGLRIALEKADPVFIRHYDFARIALARHGLEVIGDLLSLVDRCPDVALECLRRVDSVRVAEKLEDKYVGFSEEWFLRFPETGAAYIVPVALTGNAKDSTRALRLVKRLIGAGHEALVFAVATAIGDDAVLELRDLLVAPSLPPKPPSLPRFLDVATLPRPRLVDGTPLGEEHAERLVQLVACLPLDAARTALRAVKVACDAASLGDMLRVLVDRWIAADAPSKEKWILAGAAVLGDDLVTQKLAENVVAWAESGKHSLVAAGVEALAGAGTDVALTHLVRFAEKSKSKNLKKRAGVALAEYREREGLSEDMLGDRIVPDLGMDERGELVLSYGPRGFRVLFDDTGKVTLKDGEKPLRSIPKPMRDDDAELAGRAEATWNTLKKELPRIVEGQLRRLERSMVRQRTWSRDEFERYHLRHPLMLHFVRRLVWAAYDVGGAIVASFRVAEDGTFADTEDGAMELDASGRFGIAHPMALGRDVAARWGDVFGDYQIVQPFPQLARETFALDATEMATQKLVRFAGARVIGSRFFSLKHRGWDFVDYSIGKTLSHGASVRLHTEPGIAFLASKPDDQVLGDLTLHDAPSFASLGAVETSELVRDIELLRR